MTVGIVDYHMGNLGSVKRKLDLLGYHSFISSDPAMLQQADKLIMPGVGHFKRAVSELRNSGLWEFLKEEVGINKKPILGICLGLQLMTRHSEEGDEDGFGWFDAKVVRFRVSDTVKFKVPHMGWNAITKTKPCILFKGLPELPEFYFVHSYHVVSDVQEEVIATTTYCYEFVSALAKDNMFGLQFHPEKSHDDGQLVLSNFLNS